MRYNHAALFAEVADALPDRECLVFRDRRLTFAALSERVNRLANLLLSQGITIHQRRASLQPWESGQDHVALYLLNGNEYVEGMLGAAAARAASLNVNYRYVEAELAYLFNDANARAIIYHARFAPTLAAVLPDLEHPPALLLQVADESGNALLPGALDYEQALASASPARPDVEPDPDDLYVLYTGGTTGMPKGVLWTQAGILESGIGAFLPEGTFEVDTVAEGAALIAQSEPAVVLPLPPLMHGAAQWMALAGLLGGGKLVFPDVVDKLDAPAIWELIDREGVQRMNMVGNAFATPLCDEFERGDYSGASVQLVGVGGAITSASVKQRILTLLPQAVIADVAGSSETGSQLTNISTAAAPATSGSFLPAAGTCVVAEDHTRVLEPGDPATGWLARENQIPLGYLNDQAKTERTFVEVDGRRMALPGDRARHLADNTVELLGRDSVTINSGGEKIFAEEVEHALIAHPGIQDVVVVGRPSERWGSEVVAIVATKPGQDPTDAELLADTKTRLARYKLPKAFIRVPAVLRSPAGKADYRWAKDLAAGSALPV
ncbi:AMP-binding protein [Mycolicibacterium brumae]|uniref:Acyl-CoA synthetase n=1 Tax=Mycolicibacterium brumae TaxID=85968 RepID=A0A2G5P4C3_9MYCO|nr:AMP-binding protein [Mycolicibacterium brumae]MCV7191286.1 AMP-binding protein [Mycolicibacterium brumae]PIB73212.1 acyl-CoA synthetase [Mycolicibacterium brumae]RWA17810.1 acyl-CoA synthetase [Mycolicibacterium brumae DSM 44177]UWW09739.1 AMP-binding protein [Mycolicibacterium brumae]